MATEVIDITGDRYGHLTIIGQTGRGIQGSRWRAKCDCGHEVVVRGKDVRLGSTTSCGCAQRAHDKPRRDVMPGGRFGLLTVQYDSGVIRNGGRVFVCACDCGRETRVRRALLTTGQTRSCGCLRRRNNVIFNLSVLSMLCNEGRVIA